MKHKDEAYRNLVTGLGTEEADKSVHNEISISKPLKSEELSNIYMADGIGTKIINCVADDATANGWEINGDADGKLFAEMNRLKSELVIAKAAMNIRLYGGAIAVLTIADGQPLDKPAGKGAVTGMTVWSAGRVVLNEASFVTDAQSKYFDDVEVYEIKKRKGNTFKVHASRCVLFSGTQAPDCWENADATHLHFGISALQGVFDHLKGLGVSMQGIYNMLSEPDIGIYSLDGLQEQLDAEDDGVKKVTERIQVMHLAKNLLRALILGKNDTYTQVSHSFAGIPETMAGARLMLASAADIPITRLFGESASGLNATGKGDQKNYDAKVMAFQKRSLKSPIESIATMINDRNGKFVKETNLQVVFAPVNTPTQQEEIEMRFKQAQTDDLNIKNQIYSPIEARRSRYVRGYSYETSVEGE